MKAQTSIEYILVVGAAVVFVTLVVLLVKSQIIGG